MNDVGRRWDAQRHPPVEPPQYLYISVPEYIYVAVIATPVHTALSPVPAPALPMTPPTASPVCGLLEFPTIPPPAATYRYNEAPTGYPMLDREVFLDPVRERERESALEELDKKAT